MKDIADRLFHAGMATVEIGTICMVIGVVLAITAVFVRGIFK